MATQTSPSILDDPSRTWAAFDKLFDAVFTPQKHYSVPYSAYNGSSDSLSDLYGLEKSPEPKRIEAPKPTVPQRITSPRTTSPTSPRRQGNEVGSPRGKTLQKQRSKVNFHESDDGRLVTATFDLAGIKKSDIHVSYQRDRLVVTWESVTTTEREEDGRLVRERREKKYIRTIPISRRVEFEQVKATMDGRYLTITYPKAAKALPDAPARQLITFD